MEISVEFLKWTYIIACPVFILTFEIIKDDKPRYKSSCFFSQLFFLSFMANLFSYGTVLEIRFGILFGTYMLVFGIFAILSALSTFLNLHLHLDSRF